MAMNDPLLGTETFQRADGFKYRQFTKKTSKWQLIFLFVTIIVLSTLAINMVLQQDEDQKIEVRKLNSEEPALECDVLNDCDNVPFNDTVLLPFQNHYHRFIVSPKYGVSHCLLPKVMSTTSTATMCYLNNPVAFQNANRSISTEKYNTRFCQKLEKASFAEVSPLLKNLTNNIILIRNPYDRFVSGFISKCIKQNSQCHGCQDDMRCFLHKEFQRLKTISYHPERIAAHPVSDTHFAPQTWHCEMEANMKTSTVIRYGNSELERQRMIGDYVKVFRRNGVPEEVIEEIRRQMSKGKSWNSTRGSQLHAKYEQLIREDRAVRRAIQRFYYYDFQIFGFDM